MRKWQIVYEVRLHGAIGIWMMKADGIDANSQQNALAAFREKWQYKYDFRFPLQCDWIGEADEANVSTVV